MPRGGKRPGAGRKPRNAPAQPTGKRSVEASAPAAGETPPAKAVAQAAPPVAALTGWDLIEYLYTYIDGKDPRALHALAGQHGSPTDADNGMVKLQRIRGFFEKAVRGIA